MLPFAEALERAGRIIADGRNTKPLAADGLLVLFQLDELDFTERSPVRRAEEHQHRAVPAHDGFQRLRPAVLVLGRKRRHRMPDFRAGLDALAI